VINVWGIVIFGILGDVWKFRSLT